MMTLKLFISTVLMLGAFTFGFANYANNEEASVSEIKAVAEQFIEVVDKNDAESLRQLLHPDMIQYTYLGDKLIPFKGADFAQMVGDKKLGGVPRKISHKSAKIIRDNTALVVMSAVSSEYDFMYQLSLAKVDDAWVIVGILVDVNKVG
ncbi:MAG: nuclear transport factor 2 family protein [Cytophagales bacterium]|nr:nuclear transport factor 2 family protein [Cytophagales bacterium]